MDVNQQVSNYLKGLDDWQQKHFFEIVDFFQSAHPRIILHIKYGVPFFDYRGQFAYFAYNKTQKQTVLGFTRGHLFQDSQQYLSANQGQTQVRHFELNEFNQINWEALQLCLMEALFWQETLCKSCIR